MPAPARQEQLASAARVPDDPNERGLTTQRGRSVILPIWLKRARDLLYILSGEGSWSLRPHETLIVEAVLAKLDPSKREAVQAQISQSHFVERTNPRITVLRPHSPNPNLAIKDPDFGDRLFKVRIEVDGKKQTARITFYEGRLFSVETPKPGKTYRGADITVMDVVPGQPSDSLTHVIDRAEHGAGTS